MIRLSLYSTEDLATYEALSDEEKYAYFDSLGEAYAYLKEAIEGEDLTSLVATIDVI